MMADADIDEEQAQDQIDACRAELADAQSDGVTTKEAENTLSMARSFLKAGNYKMAFHFAVRARRIAAASRVKEETPRSREK